MSDQAFHYRVRRGALNVGNGECYYAGDVVPLKIGAAEIVAHPWVIEMCPGAAEPDEPRALMHGSTPRPNAADVHVPLTEEDKAGIAAQFEQLLGAAVTRADLRDRDVSVGQLAERARIASESKAKAEQRSASRQALEKAAGVEDEAKPPRKEPAPKAKPEPKPKKKAKKKAAKKAKAPAKKPAPKPEAEKTPPAKAAAK